VSILAIAKMDMMLLFYMVKTTVSKTLHFTDGTIASMQTNVGFKVCKIEEPKDNLGIYLPGKVI